jgi:hypothetical protein
MGVHIGVALNFKIFRVYPGCCHGFNVTVIKEHHSILICRLELSHALPLFLLDVKEVGEVRREREG